LSKRNNAYAWIIGIGILLFAIHNPYQPLIEYLFLPQVGMIMVVIGTLYCLMDNRKQITLGSKFIWIPLIIISVSITVSSFWQFFTHTQDFKEAFVPAIFGWILFGLYLVGRILGEKIFKPFIFIVIIESISCVVYGLVNIGVKTGGIASPTNYDMATGLLILGTVVSVVKKQWWLWIITLIGLAFTGADEAIFSVFVLIVALIIRRDWSKKLLLSISVIVLLFIIGLSTGYVQKLYQPTLDKVTAFTQAVKGQGNTDELLDVATGDRWNNHWKLSPIKPFGYGYNINNFYYGIPHNVVLIIIEQVGILAALAWLFVVFYCLVKTKWKYAFIAVLSLSVFDHFIFTQFAPFLPCLIGVASLNNLKSDFIYKMEDKYVQTV
jgi:hypothetical protein